MSGPRPAKPRRAVRPSTAGPRAPRSNAAVFGAWRHPAVLAGIAAALLYQGVRTLGFVRDDHDLIEANPYLRAGGWLGKLLTSDFWSSSGGASGLWRPLVVLSYWIDGRIGHWQPTWFHAANVLAHALATAALTTLIAGAGVGSGAALMAGLWFASMPAHVESVAWISGRTDVLCALFAFAALALETRAGGRAGLAHVAGVIAFALAVLAKEAALPFGAVIAIALWARTPALPTSTFLRRIAPYAAVTVLYLIAHHAVAARLETPTWIDAATVTRRQWAGWTMLASYVAFLWPWYPHSPERLLRLPDSPLDPAVIGGGVVLVLALAAIGFGVVRRRAWAVPLAMFVLPLLPPIALAITRGYVAFAERLVYVSSGGAAWGLGLALRRFSGAGVRASRVAWIAAAVLVAGGAIATLRLIPTWASDATMFEAMVRVQPDHAEAHVGWAQALAAAGREDEARAELDAAARLDPRLPSVPVSRAMLELRHGRWEGVLDQSRRALALDSLRQEAIGLEATALLRLRRLDEAEARITHWLARVPGDPQAEALLGQLLIVRHRPAEAIPHLERAARWITDDPALWFALGSASMQREDFQRAREAFEHTLALDPQDYESWLRLAWCARAQGDRAAFEAALARAAELPDARDGRVEAMRRESASPPRAPEP